MAKTPRMANLVDHRGEEIPRGEGGRGNAIVDDDVRHVDRGIRLAVLHRRCTSSAGSPATVEGSRDDARTAASRDVAVRVVGNHPRLAVGQILRVGAGWRGAYGIGHGRGAAGPDADCTLRDTLEVVIES